ncbi:sugar phosphate isomerase/epimerase family protein [Paenibacillus sp. FSL H8-0034]|uniref:sugar phosphate isomerase/epimerase family protein n=1 Tax=Paenibacillus sp. FSL H8-0034 TaxID=2954671 RepID=UPI0030F9AD50
MTRDHKNHYRISTLVYLDIPLEDALERMVRSGWTSIEIMCEGKHRSILNWDEEQLNWLDALTGTNGISWSLHAPIEGVNPTSRDPRIIEQSFQLLKSAIKIAERLKSSYVVIHPGFIEDSIPHPTMDLSGYNLLRAKAVTQTADFMRQLITLTNGELGIPIALENVPPSANRFGSDCDFLMDVLHEVKSDRLKILLDVGHAHMVGSGQSLDELEKCKTHLIGLHLNDNHGNMDEHLAIGQGTIPFNTLIHGLKDTDNELIWVLEMVDESDALDSVTPLDKLRANDDNYANKGIPL